MWRQYLGDNSSVATYYSDQYIRYLVPVCLKIINSLQLQRFTALFDLAYGVTAGPCMRDKAAHA
jgi:hypothetical protein